MEFGNGTGNIGVKDFPPFVRIMLGRNARKEIFFRAMRKVGTMKREYNSSRDIFEALYGKKKSIILKLLSENSQPAKKLVEDSGLSPSAVYHFLGSLKSQDRIVKKGRTYSLGKYDLNSLTLQDIVKLEEDSSLRRRYGISIKELELGYFLWDQFLEVVPEEGGYAKTYQTKYTLADAIHRWRTGRTDIPVWALNKLVELSPSEVLHSKGSVVQYHLPPGIPVQPSYEGEYKLPVHVDGDLDKVVIQLLQKMSKNHLYTFPKKRKWLFDSLHQHFGAFDDSTSRIPSAIAEILKSFYGVKTLNRSLAYIPPRMKTRWRDLNPLFQIREESSLLLHILSLSSRSNGGFEITSRSKPFLQDISRITFDLGLGDLTVRKKQSRPHFRAYLSEGKVDVLRKYTQLFQMYPDLEIWMRIPLNKIADNLVLTDADPVSVEHICREELSRFVESILRSLERKRKERPYYGKVDYLQYKEKIVDYFWEQKLIPTSRRVEEMVGAREAEEESVLYV